MSILRGAQRRGFVLLTVILVSALLVISALMFGGQLIAETHITKTDALFKNALSVAETGVNTTLSTIANPTNDTWARHLQDGTGSTGSPVSVASVHGTYSVDVTVVPGSVVSLGSNKYTGTIVVDSTGIEYPPSVAAASMATSTDYSARRRIQTRATAAWTYVPSYVIPGLPYIAPGTSHPEVPEVGYWATVESGVGYGVFTGGDFSTQGSAKEIKGDICAGGNASIKKNSVSGGKVYAHGSLTGSAPTGSMGGVPSVAFPVIDIPYYRSLFTEYINGTYPYDGTNAAYTNTSSSTAGGLANRALYKVDNLAALTSNVTIDGKTYKAIPSGNATAAMAYMTNSTASYFVSGDLHVNAQTSLTGTLVVDGTIFVNGGANILAGTKMPAIMATGNFVKNNGNATINGLVYTEGSFTGNGTADIVGALYARGTVNMSGNMSITYDASIDAIVTRSTWVVTTPYQPAVNGAEGQAATSDVTVPAVYQVDDVQRLDQSQRSWVEVAPGS